MNKDDRERHFSGYSGKDSMREKAIRMFGPELRGKGVTEGFPASFSAPGREKARLYRKGGHVSHDQHDLHLPRRVPTPRLNQEDLHSAQVMRRGGHAKKHHSKHHYAEGGNSFLKEGPLKDHFSALIDRLGPLGGVARTIGHAFGADFSHGGYATRGRHRGYRRHRAEGGELEGTHTSTMTGEHPDMPAMEHHEMPSEHHEPVRMEEHHEAAPEHHEPEHREPEHTIPEAPPAPEPYKFPERKRSHEAPRKKAKGPKAAFNPFAELSEGQLRRARLKTQFDETGKDGLRRGGHLGRDGSQHYDFGGIVKGLGTAALHLLPSLIPMLMKKGGGRIDGNELMHHLQSAQHVLPKRHGGHLRRGHSGHKSHHYAKGGHVYESMMVGEPGHSRRAPKNNWESVMRGEHPQRVPEHRKSQRHPSEDMSHGTVYKRGGKMAAGGVAKMRHGVANKQGKPMHGAHIQRTPNLFG